MRNFQRTLLSAAALLAAVVAPSGVRAFDRGYAGASAALVLPQGGAGMRHLGGATARFGYYMTETFALDGGAAWLEDRAGLSARALWHLQGWEAWGKLFGYARFDPFLTAGVQGWLPRGQVGPTCGFGALYYLSETWALRADADVTLGLDAGAAAVFALSAGVQYSF